MRIAFVGGFGHHYLRGALSDPVAGDIEKPVAFARASEQDDHAAELARGLGDVRFYDDADRMLDEFRPDVLSVGAEVLAVPAVRCGAMFVMQALL